MSGRVTLQGISRWTEDNRFFNGYSYGKLRFKVLLTGASFTLQLITISQQSVL